MIAHEINFDGLVGPTHNYAVLSYGNIASMKNNRSVSSPKQAALQALAKRKLRGGPGVKRAIFPPPVRPHARALRKLGFTGRRTYVRSSAKKSDSLLRTAVRSSGNMWAAEAKPV